jgi:hypothetical protein
MAREISFADQTGGVDYVILVNNFGQFRRIDTAAWEFYSAANYANYKRVATEAGASGIYLADFPTAVASGRYNLIAKRQVGGSPAESDPSVGAGEVQWNGSVIVDYLTEAQAVDSQLSNAHGSGTWGVNLPGGGAFTVTVTVTDGATVLQNARVRMTLGVNSYFNTTDTNGQAVFNLDAATYTVSITLGGYSFTGAALAVTGNTSQTYAMAQQVITPSPAGFTTGYLSCYDQYGMLEQGVNVSIQIKEGVVGITVDDTVRAVQSDVNGLVQFTNMLKGAVYFIWRGTSPRKYTVTIPASAGTTYVLPSVIGAP